MHKYAVSMSKTVLFQAIQFSISTLFSFIWPIDGTPSSANTPSQSEPEWGTPHLSKLQHYRNLTIILFSVFNQDTPWWWWGVLLLCREAISIVCSPSQLANENEIVRIYWYCKFKGTWCKKLKQKACNDPTNVSLFAQSLSRRLLNVVFISSFYWGGAPCIWGEGMLWMVVNGT